MNMELVLIGKESTQNFYEENSYWEDQERGGRIMLKRILGRQVMGLGD
jgi:hypothetical protein